jgi:branched-chain amino acid transport system ATP-binding protein
MILKVENVSKFFGKLAAVHDLSFDVDKGEVFGIAGPNGAGKTTLLNVIAGRYRGSGKIIFRDTNISGLRPHQICNRGIARTFQIPLLFLPLSIFQNVRVGAHFGVRKDAENEDERIRLAVDFVGLNGMEGIPAKNLDLFHKRLTMFAAALATKPGLLLLDEPIGGLSPVEIRNLMTLIKRINEELGITIIIIEHIMKALTALCQRLLILNNGERICIGPPLEVTRDRKVREVYLGVDHA